MGTSEKVTFTGSQGARLSGRLDLPAGRVRACALFAHCFTCSKDLPAATRISRALAARGFAVLRFDFTGLGASEGEFANTNFSSNVQDLVVAAGFLRERLAAPEVLIGHSLGGAAMLVAAHESPACRAGATIGAPADPAHVRRLLADDVATIRARGRAEVELAGRRFTIEEQFLDDLERQEHQELIGRLRLPLLILHAPTDQVVGIDNARLLFEAAKHPKSFVSLDDADHMLMRRQDAEYVSEVLSAWASRYLGDAPLEDVLPEQEPGRALVRTTGVGKFQQVMRLGRHSVTADEPVDMGGDDTGPSPYELLLGALGSCTAMTLGMYARRKRWPLTGTTVALRHEKRYVEDCEGCEKEGAKIDFIERELVLEGDLTDEQRERLREIADKCPVHRTLRGEVRIETRREE